MMDSETNQARRRVSKLWLRFGYLSRAFQLPDEMYAKIPEIVLDTEMLNFYVGFENSLGATNCKLNLHIVSKH